MSRAGGSRPQGDGPAHIALMLVRYDNAKVAEDIGIAALELAERARAAGLTTIGFLLESVALEAGAEAATRQLAADVSPER